MRLTSCFLALSVAPLVAQTSKVVPSTHATVEGNSTYTYPFGRTTGAIQLLVNAGQLSTSASALVSSVEFRSNGLLTGASTSQGHAKAYKVTCWNTSVLAAAMTTSATANAGTALPTVVYAATLNLPNAGIQPVLPAPFTIALPFNALYPFDGSTSNFLMQVESTDTVVPPSTWPVDAISVSKSVVTGIGVKIGSLCTYNGVKLDMSYGSAQAANAVAGGAITYPLSTTSPGSWPTVIAILGATNASPGFPLDLSTVAMPGCWLNVDPVATTTVLESAGTYPNVTWPVPNLPTLVGGTVYVQNLGLNTLSSLIGAVTTDAYAVTIGNPASPYPVTTQSIFSGNLTSWSMSAAGAFHPVVRFQGVLP